jgi:hypothetical protein
MARTSLGREGDDGRAVYFEELAGLPKEPIRIT